MCLYMYLHLSNFNFVVFVYIGPHGGASLSRNIWYNARMTESMRHLDTTQKETLDKLSRLEERVREMKERESALSPSSEKRKEERGTQVTPLPPEIVIHIILMIVG